MNILHLSHSTLAGAPLHITNFLNKYSKTHNYCMVKSNRKAMNWDYDLLWKDDESSIELFRSLVEKSDIVHIHHFVPFGANKTCWSILRDFVGPIIVQVHSSPEHFSSFCYPYFQEQQMSIDRLLCIAQYQSVFLLIQDFVPVRNVVDIYDELLMPVAIENQQLKVSFSPSHYHSFNTLKRSKNRSLWSYKGQHEVLDILNQLTQENVCTYTAFQNTKYTELLKQRQKHDIHIDDIFTGSYHLNSLESLAQGKVTICNIDTWMERFLLDFLKCDALPWVIADSDNLYKVLYNFLHDVDLIRSTQSMSRKWMEDNWNVDSILNDYMGVYNKL